MDRIVPRSADAVAGRRLRVALCWSGGEDSALALWWLRRRRVAAIRLLTR
jgi:hypothetical protein